jgi:flagellar motor switch protein FliN
MWQEQEETVLSALDNLKVNLSVVLGRNRMPVHMLLRMGRGAVIELEATETDMVEILANGHPIARGQIIVTGTRIAIEVTEIIRKPEVIRTAGVTIGDAAIAPIAAAAA